jgi:hypothetical protein
VRQSLAVTHARAATTTLASLVLVVLAACEEAAPPREATALRGSDFVCADDVCTQRFPALPDDGEWECLDHDGLVICRGGHGPAGVHAGPPDDAFSCAPLGRDDEGRRVCVDAQPDLPSPEGWRCQFDQEGGEPVRRCERGDTPRLGDRCGESDACPAGLVCLRGRCALEREGPPECWLDGDCEGGASCVLARCVP